MRSFLLAMLCMIASPSFADCVCACMNGDVVPLCESAIDLEPICAPRICPLTTPSIEPINPPTLAPLGTQNCSQQQVYNESSGQYEWQEVCY